MANEDKNTKITIEALFAELDKDPDLRATVVNYLAKKHSRDFLSRVTIRVDDLKDGALKVSGGSNKEWQE